MKIRLLPILFFAASLLSGASDFEKGAAYYKNRHEGAQGIKASTENIDKAIHHFQKAIKEPAFELESAVYLLQCYYYKAEFAIQDIAEKKRIFNDGKALGSQYIELYPENVKFRYWYLVNLGSWAQVYGILTAAREGVADQMKTHSEKIIELDAAYQDGGGYFMLGAVHYKSPYIPFILSWPDNDDAIKYLQKAHDTGTATLNQKNYLAQALYKDGEKDKAKQLLNEVIGSDPLPENLVEELDDIREAKEILAGY